MLRAYDRSLGQYANRILVIITERKNRKMTRHMQKINDGGVSVGPDAAGFIPNDMFVSTFTDQQHFTYLDGNGNLQDVWYDGPNNRWNLQQINNANGNGPTVPGEFIASAQATAPAERGIFVSTFRPARCQAPEFQSLVSYLATRP
jgi:hypothetical protein